MNKPGLILVSIAILCIITVFIWGGSSGPEARLLGVWSNGDALEDGASDAQAFVDFASDGTFKMSIPDSSDGDRSNEYDGTYEVIDEKQLFVTVGGESRFWTYQVDGDNLVLDVPRAGKISMVLEARHNKFWDDALRATGLKEQLDDAVDKIVESQGDADQLLLDALRVATDVQAWSMKPAQFGGMASNETLADATMEKVKPTASQSSLKSASFLLETTSRCRTEPEIPSKKSIQIYVNAHDEKETVRVCVGIAGQGFSDVGYVVEP